jgi:hypothetical protein
MHFFFSFKKNEANEISFGFFFSMVYIYIYKPLKKQKNIQFLKLFEGKFIICLNKKLKIFD